MARRIRALTDDDHLVNEKMDDLSARLKLGGYPEGMVRSAIQMALGLSVSDLRKVKLRSEDDNCITFVYTYDPEYPDFMNNIKSIISRLFTSRECKPIFGNSRVIDSRREPASLLRMFQHSRFDDPWSAPMSRG